MRRYINLLLPIMLILFFAACSGEKELFVKYSEPDIAYEGRIDTTDTGSAELYWPGSSIKIRFEGKAIGAVMGESGADNYYNVIVDDDDPFIFRPDTVTGYQQLVTGLSPGVHSLEMFRRTEWDRGTTSFYGFRINGRAKLLPREDAKKRKIEFYGNSITAGYAVEDTTGGDSPDSTYTNNYLSYAAIIARHYDARYHCSSKGGIGITISWFPMIMPEAYDRLDPLDAESKWDFSLYQPDIIVINLMQNDSWLVYRPEHPEFAARFGEEAPGEDEIIAAYQDFVAGIRGHYPGSYIICALGNMDATRKGSIWPGYVKKAVENLGDSKILTHFVPYKETPGHPSVSEQEDMADSFIRFIDKHINW